MSSTFSSAVVILAGFSFLLDERCPERQGGGGGGGSEGRERDSGKESDGERVKTKGKVQKERQRDAHTCTHIFLSYHCLKGHFPLHEG